MTKVPHQHIEFVRENYNKLTISEIGRQLEIEYNQVYYIVRMIKNEIDNIIEQIEPDEPQPVIINRPAAQYSNPQWHKLYQYAG